jgi:hypothetical protein
MRPLVPYVDDKQEKFAEAKRVADRCCRAHGGLCKTPSCTNGRGARRCEFGMVAMPS